MTHIDQSVIDAAMPYFETRDRLARLLKAAGVKKHAREYVAEVLLDAGVIDLDELDQLAAAGEGDTAPAEPSADTLAAEWLDRPAWWNDREGTVVATDGDGMLAQWAAKGVHPGKGHWLPVSWLTHEPPAPDINLDPEGP